MKHKTFRIGKLAKEVGVEQFVIRFWEKAFNISPKRTQGQQRLYTQKHLELFTRIKLLLYDRGFTIAGAKEELHNEPQKKEVVTTPTATTSSHDQAEQNLFNKELLQVQQKLYKLRDTLST
ncbi:MAG: MerR family transcriptional regulator [Candidatus Babeliales bacterium]